MPCFQQLELAIKRRNCRMIGKKGPAIWAVVLALTLTLSAWGAGQRRNQQQGQSLEQLEQQTRQATQKTQPQQIIRLETKDEVDAYNAMIKEQDPAKKIAMAEEFVSKFPDSDGIPTAHMFRLVAYGQLGKHKEAAAA